MYQKTFKNNHNPRRPIMVKMDDDFISFHFPYENDLEFYWIPVNEWISAMREHMRQKEWYSHEMEDFINRCIDKIPVSDTTVENIAGFHFYITWTNKDEGTDHRGNKWVNRSDPQCLNQNVIDTCLDAFNAIKKVMEDGLHT